MTKMADRIGKETICRQFYKATGFNPTQALNAA